MRRIVSGTDGQVIAVELDAAVRIGADAVVVSPRFRARAEPFPALGLELTAHPSGLGDVVASDATGATSVPGLYAAGNVTDPSQQVAQAAANGSRVGAMISFSLADDDLRATARPSANEADWDHRYGDVPMWSGNPNGTLVNETRDIAPGRALDVGAGEGADALWLAENDWHVTATDISRRALERVDAEATRRGLRVTCQHADANALDPFEAGAFDLVSAQYVSIPRTPDGRGVHNLPNAVAPGVRRRRLRSRRRPRCRNRRRRQRGTSRFTRRDLDPRARHPRRTTSTTSCCAPDAGSADDRNSRLRILQMRLSVARRPLLPSAEVRRLCTDKDDHGTRELLEDILEGEEEHAEWLETQLEAIRKLASSSTSRNSSTRDARRRSGS